MRVYHKVKYMRYLIRLDDITEGTNWKYLEQLDKVFDKYDIKPILGVVPDNKDIEIVDKNQKVGKEIFFEKIRRYQSRNYIIAMHGVEHDLQCTSKKSIVNINNYGELVNLSYDEKKIKLMHGKKILDDNNINTTMYMPPAHWIDNDTINILNQLDFKYITDGLFAYPKKINNIWFIPQQLWRPRKMIIPGLFTNCLHINTMNQKSINNAILFIEENNCKFINFDDIVYSTNLLNRFYSAVLCTLFNIYIYCRRFKK